MGWIGRRGFIASLLALPAAAKALALTPSSPPLKPLGLTFHPAAFEMMTTPTRMDIIYGWGCIVKPTQMIRIVNGDEGDPCA